jgi:hypothetical protein
LLAINGISGMASESWETWARFSDIKRGGDTVFPSVKSTVNSEFWIWGYRPTDGHGTQYFHGGNFSNAEDCLRSLWTDLVTLICDEIFPDPSVRKEHKDLIRSNITLFEGRAYGIEDLKFLISNLRGIMEGGIDPSAAAVIRKRFPYIWKSLGDKKNDGFETSADLGDLGF